MGNPGHLNAQTAYAQLLKAIIDNDGVECELTPDLFFPKKDSMQHISIEIFMAKRVCARCPISNTCLQYAIVGKEAFGIWGGMTTEERKSVTAFGRVS